MLDSLEATFGNLPANFKGNPKSNFDLVNGILRDEEYFLNHCPVELTSILLKLIVELIVSVGYCDKVEEIPECISKLLFLANSKSDLSLEKELFENYLHDCKSIIEQEILSMRIQLQTEKEKQSLTQLKRKHET